MQEALAGVMGSVTDTDGAVEPGVMEAGLQMEEIGVLTEVEGPQRPPLWLVEVELDEEEEDVEPVLDTAGGLNWPLLSEPVLSRAGDNFFLTGRVLELEPPLCCCCCCCRHLARRFLNHTWVSRVTPSDKEGSRCRDEGKLL